MDISFEGYAAQAATFYADDAVLPGSAVMLGENLTVYPVEENADILGVALAVRDGCATVQTAGADERTPSRSQYFSWVNSTNEGSTESQTLANIDYLKTAKKYGIKF